jgi:colanic acid biosynthesis glycosyl transferase WcaI
MSINSSQKTNYETITLISGYYYPEDTAIGLYNTQLAEFLVNSGYKVNVITGFPSYPQWEIRADYKNKGPYLTETHNQVSIFRYRQFVPSSPTFLKRIVLTIDFTLGSIVNVFKVKKTDIIICVVPHTATLFLGWLLKIRTKAKVWNHIQDFEFDAAQQTGISKSDGILKKMAFKILFYLESKLLNIATVNSTISKSMLNRLREKSNKEVFYFPNWIDSSKIDPSHSEVHRYMTSKAFKILYSGNIGDKQDWSLFLKVVNGIADKNVEIIIVGDGSKKDWLLEESAKHSNNIKFYPPVSFNELSNLLCSADLHILFQKQNVVDSVMPSKLLGMMASAKPSLIVGNSKSEVKNIILESGGGYYISKGSIDQCLSTIQILMDNPSQSKEMGLKAREYVISKFSKNSILTSFKEKLLRVKNG